jgi:hypothetical protein
MIYRGREPAGRFGDAEAGVDEDGEPLRWYEGELTTNYVPTLDYVQYLIDGHLVDPDTVEPVGMAMIDEGFRAAYRELEGRMKKRAEDDGDVFLPNPQPLGPVQYVFVCMEPSLGRWARAPDEAKAKIDAGFRNFTSSIEDFILHFCIRQYLCTAGQRYHITDLSKGAMLTKLAGDDRTQRYERWYPLLVDEVDLVATPGAKVFAVGGEVARHLKRHLFPRSVIQVIHYSGLAGRARAVGIVGHEDRFEEFRGSVSLERLLATAADVLMASAIPARFRDKTLARLAMCQLSESRQQLLFNYKLAFEGPLR